MLPPTISLSIATRPGALALATPGPQLAAAVTIASLHAATNVAVQSYKQRNVQLSHAHHFHWWCRRSPRRYSSWGRSDNNNGKDGQDAEGTSSDKTKSTEEMTPRERYLYLRRSFLERFMRENPYEGLFGASNRMLKGMNWTEWPHAQDMLRKMREVDKRLMEAKAMGGAWNDRLDAAFFGPDSEFGKTMKKGDEIMAKAASLMESNMKPSRKDKVDAKTTNAASEASSSWEYDAISGRMVPVDDISLDKKSTSKPNTKGDSWVDIPVKPYRPKVDAADIAKTAAQVSSAPAVESAGQDDTPRRPNLPKDDIDLLSAEDVRAGMGHIKNPHFETPEQKSIRRTELETNFKQVQEESEKVSRPSTTRSSRPDDAMQWRLQRQALEEAAKDFMVREKRIRRAIRELEGKAEAKLAQLSALRDQCNELARKGTITLLSNDLVRPQETLQADARVLEKASSLLAAATLSAPRLPQPSSQHMQPSLDRYAWDKKPFAKILDAEQLVQNARDSLESVEETLENMQQRVATKARLAGIMNQDVEGVKRAMRGYEEKWHKREDRISSSTTRGAVDSDPALSAIEEQVNIGKHDASEDALRAENEASAMSLGAIPDLPPASLDGGLEYEPMQSRETAYSAIEAANPSDTEIEVPSTEAGESVYTILALDPAMGSITTATTSSTAKAMNEEPMPLAQALQQLAQPAMFLSHLPKLKEQGFEPVKASENLLVLKKMSPHAARTAPERREVELDFSTASGVPQLQLTDPLRMSIKIQVPAPSSASSSPRDHELRTIFEDLPLGLQQALETGSLYDVNEVLGTMTYSDAKEAVLAMTSGIITSDQGTPVTLIDTNGQALYYPANTVVGKSEQADSTPGATATKASLPSTEPEKTSEESDIIYSTKLQSPTTSTFQGLRPKRTEPVFSGTQAGHRQYEELRAKLRHMRRHEMRRARRRPWRRVKRIVSRALWLALMGYVIGAVIEMNRKVNERVERRKKWKEASKVDGELQE